VASSRFGVLPTTASLAKLVNFILEVQKMKMSVKARNNFVIVDGEEIPCGSGEEALQVCDLLATGGYHLTDAVQEAKMAVEMGIYEPEENFTDHVGMLSVTKQDADEYLSLLEEMLSANTEAERNEILKLCREGSYPDVPEMAVAALRSLDIDRARKLMYKISAKLPEVFRGMQEFCLTA